MKAIHQVLVRTLVKEFYRENSGFFLLVIGLACGFLRKPEHVAIASGLAFNPIYYLVVLALWAFYTFKALHFCHGAKRLSENWFLTEVSVMKPVSRKLTSLYLQCLLLAPILAYGFFLMVTAAQLGETFSALVVGFGNVLIVLISAHFLDQKLVEPVDAMQSSRFRDWTRFLPKWYSMYFIHHLFQRYGFSLVLSKLFSVGLIFGATAVFNMESVDLRYLALGVLLASAINSGFALKHLTFERHDMAIFRNLPISNISIFWKDCLTYFILSIPEILVLFGNNIFNIPTLELVKIGLLLPVLLMLHRSIMLIKIRDMEQYMKYVFFSTAILFFTILGHTDLLIIESLALLTSLTFYIRLKHVDE